MVLMQNVRCAVYNVFSVSLSSAESDSEDAHARKVGAAMERQEEFADTAEFLMQYGDITDGFFRLRNMENGAGVSTES